MANEMNTILGSEVSRPAALPGRFLFVANGHDVDPNDWVYIPKAISLVYLPEIREVYQAGDDGPEEFFTHLRALEFCQLFPLATIAGESDNSAEDCRLWSADWSEYQHVWEAIEEVESRSNENRRRHDAASIVAIRELLATGSTDWHDMPADECPRSVLAQSWAACIARKNESRD